MMLLSPVSAAPVTFWFAGQVARTNSHSTALPLGIEIGTPFAGRVTYDADFIDYQSTSAGGDIGNYYFRTLAGFSAHIQMGTHTLTNARIATSGWSGNISVYNDFQNADQMFIDIGQAGLIMDGQQHTNSVIELYLNDQSLSAHASRSLPTQGPTAVAFPDQRELTWTEQDGHGKLLFGLSGSITHLTTAPLVLLNVRRLDNDQLRISWPLAVSGGTLEESDGLAPEDWHPVGEDVLPDGMENAVILPPGSPARFFRLILP